MGEVTHKEIRLQCARGVGAAVLRAIGRFNAAFPADEIYLRGGDCEVVVFVRCVDVGKLRRVAGEFDAELEEDSGKGVFADVVAAVEGIKSYSPAGGKRLFVGYNRERKVVGRVAKVAARTPFFYAQDHGFSREENALPAEFVDAIVCADSEELLRRLPDNCVDLIFTSPPYNFGLEYSDSGDAAHWDNYFEKLYAVLRQCVRVLKFGGRIAVNVQPLFSDYIPSHHLLSQFFMREKMIWKGEVLWEKNNYNCKYTAWGSWKSPSNPYLKYTWEFIEVFCKGALKKEGAREDIDISGDDFKQWVTAKWSLAPERRMKEFGHPAMFPESLAVRVLQLLSYRRDVVLDPFNGVGTTTAVARRLGRRFLGVDVSEQYCETARGRVRGEEGKKGLFV